MNCPKEPTPFCRVTPKSAAAWVSGEPVKVTVMGVVEDVAPCANDTSCPLILLNSPLLSDHWPPAKVLKLSVSAGRSPDRSTRKLTEESLILVMVRVLGSIVYCVTVP